MTAICLMSKYDAQCRNLTVFIDNVNKTTILVYIINFPLNISVTMYHQTNPTGCSNTDVSYKVVANNSISALASFQYQIFCFKKRYIFYIWYTILLRYYYELVVFLLCFFYISRQMLSTVL